ncbi:MAB_1171c family putative transporter [Microbacterium oxydans]|uniref:MAB_1171c family putative transporter n=1 Tax=Microbacterium oxydans TaxID=82380 RepID=UPI003641BF3A
MIQTLVAALLWALVASLLVLRRRRTDRSITYAALTIAVAMTLNVDVVYVLVDRLLASMNFATLLSDALLMIGLFFLGRAAMKAGEYRPRMVRAAVGRSALIVALVGTTTSFFLIDRGMTTATFMIDLGGQPWAAAYSIIGFTYCGIVLGAMLALAIRQLRIGHGAQRVPASLLVIGSASGISLSVAVLIMDLAHLTGNLRLMRSVGAAYGPLTLLAFLFLCAGFAGQPVVRNLQERSRRVRTTEMLQRLDPLWRRAMRVRPGLSSAHSSGPNTENPEGQLHREIVEIRDAMIDPRVAFEVAGAEQALLEQAERHLLGSAARDAQASVTSAQRPPGEQEPT